MQLTKFALNLAAMAALGLSPLMVQASAPSPAAQMALPPATLVKDINTASNSAFYYTSGPFVTSTHYAYFVASDDNQTISVWRSDGTAAGTLKIPHIVGTKDTPDTIEINGTIGDKALITVSHWQWDPMNFYYVRTSLDLWMTDGTDAGTKIIKSNIGATDVITLHNNSYFIDSGTSGLWQVDPNTGNVTLAVALGGATRGHLVLNDVLYYILSLNGSSELWRTDGTQQSTQQLAVLGIFNAQSDRLETSATTNVTTNRPTRQSPNTHQQAKPNFGIPSPPVTPKFAAISNTVYLRMDTILWKSDGTPAGTTQVSNQLGNENPNDQSPMLALGNKLFFVAANGAAGSELWSSDGTPQGTGLFKDLVAGNPSSGPHLFTQVGGIFYFRASDIVGNIALWKSDGTVDGTQMVTPTLWPNNSPPDSFVILNDKAYFVAPETSHGRQLWVSDGTAAGTQRISDIGAGEVVIAGPSNLTPLGSHLLFTADSANAGRELWVSDGSTNSAGTHLLKDLNPNNADSNVNFLATTLGKTFLVAHDTAHGRALWASDGSANGTQFLFDLPEVELAADVGYIGTVGSNAYFFHHSSTDSIWRTDGSITNTKLITQFVGDASLYSYPAIAFNDQIFVRSSYNTLYRINPDQNDAITKVKDFAGLLPYNAFIVSGDSLWIYMDPPLLAHPAPQLWHSDGADGVTLVHTFEEVNGASNIYYELPKITSFNGSTYFSHYGSSVGTPLWKTDGTEANTSLVKVLSDSVGIPFVTGLLTATQHIYATTGTDAVDETCQHICYRGQLWQSDGTLTGTVVLTTTPYISAAFTTLYPFGTLSDSVMFVLKTKDNTATVLTYRYSLWRVDDGTGSIEPLTNVIFDDLDTSQIRNINGILYFRGGKNQLWQTDGTSTGTKLVHSFTFSTTIGDTGIHLLSPLHNGLLIGAYDQSWSLWHATGGQVTQILTQPTPMGSFSSDSPPSVQPLGDSVLFNGFSNQYGSELWRLDLTDAQNLSVQAIATQPAIPAASSTLPITVFSERFGQVATATLTATLPVSVTYITDTLGISPTINGNTVVWQINNLAFGARDFTLRLGLPNAALGTRYPITFTLSTPLTDTTASDNTATTELWLAAQTFLPVMVR